MKGGEHMAWENSMESVLEEIQETEKLSLWPGDSEATITAECGAFLSLACC